MRLLTTKSLTILHYFSLNIQHFEIKSGAVQLWLKFHGIGKESPYLHFCEFKEVCATIKLQNISEWQLRFKLFPFSLKDKTYMVTFLTTKYNWKMGLDAKKIPKEIISLLSD